MATLIIYDNSGHILIQATGDYRLPRGGIQYIEVDSDLYKNKIIKAIDAETKELILEDIPKTELQILQESIETMQNYILEKETENSTSSL